MAKFKGEILICLECGNEFKIPPSRSKIAKYCSKECADVHRHDTTKIEKVRKNCLRCGKEFYEHPCHSERRKFCSYECANIEQIVEETRICKYCGELFKVNPSSPNVCCSWKCRVGRSKTEDWPTRKKILRQCVQCGKEFWKKPSDVKKSGGKYCSKECVYEANTFPVGKIKDKHFYTSTFWKELRKKILKRDKYCCQKCSFSGNGLHIHHLETRRNGGEDAENNLITLCNHCHRMIHVGNLTNLARRFLIWLKNMQVKNSMMPIRK